MYPPQSLRTRLLTLVSLSLLPAILVALIAWGWLRENANRYAEQEANRYAGLILITLESELAQTQDFLATVAVTIDPDTIETEGCSHTMRTLLDSAPRYIQLGVASPTGEIVCSALPLTGPVSISDRLYFQRAVVDRTFSLGEYQVGRITHRSSINAAMPVVDSEGMLHGVVYVAFDLALFDSLFETFELPNDSTLVLFQSDGHVLARFPHPGDWVGESLSESRIFLETRSIEEEHYVTLLEADGVERTYFHSVLSAAATQPIEFALGIPQNVATRYVDRLFTWTLAVYIGLTAVASTIAWLLGERIILKVLRPLIAATEQLVRAESAELSFPKTGIREFDSLSRAFEQMSESLHAEQARRSRAEQDTRVRLDQLASLRAIDQAILSGADLSDTLKLFLRESQIQLGAQSARVYLFDDAISGVPLSVGDSPLIGGPVGVPSGTDSGPRARSVLAERALHSGIIETLELDATHSGDIQGVLCAIPLSSQGKIVGVLEVEVSTALVSSPEWEQFAYTLAGQGAIAVENKRLIQALQDSHTQIRAAYDDTIAGWAAALDLRDQETVGHSWRVMDSTVVLAEQMGISSAEIVHIRRGALLHDIGKLGIPDEILRKPSALSEGEWVIMRRHPGYAHEWLSKIDYLRPALDIPLSHHERWDGMGYPEGLKGEAIPLSARIFAVVDVWDALTNDRPYRSAWTHAQALEYVRAESGKHFDPEVVRVFLESLNA